jgi:molybdenum-dependent DNA-binding transcriptional regulator ModE
VRTAKKSAAIVPATTDSVKRQPRPRVRLRIDFDAARAVGPGKIKLLELIEMYGSISEAGRQMALSYRRAWLLVDACNEAFALRSLRRGPAASTAAARR